MKRLGDILAPGVAEMQIREPQEVSQDQKRMAEGKLAVDHLFEILRIHCRNFDYVLAHNVDPEFCKREWVRTFMQHGMNMQRVSRGIRKIRDNGYGRMIYPVEFVKLTLPEPQEMGAPNVHDAFSEASSNSVRDGTEKKWSHPAVRYAFNKTSSWSLSHEPAHVVKPVFELHYLEGCLLAFEGKILDQISVDSDQEKYDHYAKENMIMPQYKNMDFKSALESMKKQLGK